MSAKSKKTLKDSLLEKLSPEKREQVMKDYNLGKRYIKTPSKDIKTGADNLQAAVSSIKNLGIRHTEARDGPWSKYLSVRSKNLPSSSNSMDDNKSGTNSIVKGECGDSVSSGNIKPSCNDVGAISIGVGDCPVYPKLTITMMDTINVIGSNSGRKSSVSLYKRDSLIKKAICKSISEAPSGLIIGAETGNQWCSNKSCDSLTEEAINLRNSLCAELNEFIDVDGKKSSSSIAKRGKSVVIAKSMLSLGRVSGFSSLKEEMTENESEIKGNFDIADYINRNK